jgi:hypothetical protein
VVDDVREHDGVGCRVVEWERLGAPGHVAHARVPVLGAGDLAHPLRGLDRDDLGVLEGLGEDRGVEPDACSHVDDRARAAHPVAEDRRPQAAVLRQHRTRTREDAVLVVVVVDAAFDGHPGWHDPAPC